MKEISKQIQQQINETITKRPTDFIADNIRTHEVALLHGIVTSLTVEYVSRSFEEYKGDFYEPTYIDFQQRSKVIHLKSTQNGNLVTNLLPNTLYMFSVTYDSDKSGLIRVMPTFDGEKLSCAIYINGQKLYGSGTGNFVATILNYPVYIGTNRLDIFLYSSTGGTFKLNNNLSNYFTNFRASDFVAPLPPVILSLETKKFDALGTTKNTITWRKNEEIDLNGYKLYRTEPIDKVEWLKRMQTYSDGKATFTKNSFDVIGIGTTWTTLQLPLKIRNLATEIWYEVDEIVNNTLLRLKTRYLEDSATNVSYEIRGMEDEGLEYRHIKTLTALEQEYTDTPVVFDKGYFYRLSAYDYWFNESDKSEYKTILSGDTTPPSVPTGLTAIGGQRRIILKWNKNPEPDVDYYEIFRSDSETGTYVSIAKLDATAYIDEPVEGTKWYKIRAVDVNRNIGNFTSIVQATATAPTVTVREIRTFEDVGLEDFCIIGAETYLVGAFYQYPDSSVVMFKGTNHNYNLPHARRIFVCQTKPGNSSLPLNVRFDYKYTYFSTYFQNNAESPPSPAEWNKATSGFPVIYLRFNRIPPGYDIERIKIYRKQEGSATFNLLDNVTIQSIQANDYIYNDNGSKTPSSEILNDYLTFPEDITGLLKVQFITPSLGYVIGKVKPVGYSVLKTTNGNTFVSKYYSSEFPPRCMFFENANVGYIGRTYGGILYTNDGLDSYSIELTWALPNAICSNGIEQYACSRETGTIKIVRRELVGGSYRWNSNFNDSETYYLKDIHCYGDLWVSVGSKSTILVKKGTEWKKYRWTVDPDLEFNCVYCKSDKIIYVGANMKGIILASEDGGETFFKLYEDIPTVGIKRIFGNYFLCSDVRWNKTVNILKQLT